ncbi:copper resistance protein NlpE [Shewanella profunda]|uniref:copper resistance protein NlpE n=1 Tax=Shewanella profunda TaxID=254793 RepID=UPI00200D76D5|nr:copper resistance protein NlpE [Shewanella profunda]MCL1090131.1 copper resistance protein NlpE [Shewanella profunda]
MKKSLFGIALLALFTTACSDPAPTPTNTAPAQTEPASSTPLGDTSQNSLDWPGDYEGILPCASCEGIETHISLQADNSFEVKTIYLGKDEKILKVTGTAVWDAQGQKITLADGSQYLVGENQLIMLDTEGKRITGDLAANYVLKKKSE